MPQGKDGNQMAGNNSYFFDTYALFEIVVGNHNYARVTNNVKMITTRMNLMELHYQLLTRYSKEYAEKVYAGFKEFVIDVSDEEIQLANEFRATNKKARFSYIDCIGYIMAGRRGVKFLTGDKAFEKLENVEFVR